MLLTHTDHFRSSSKALWRTPSSRRGISLFEVVLALSIFLGAMAAISQVLRTGSRAAVRAQLQSQASLLCDRQMNRVLAGIEPMQSAPQSALDDKQDWYWTLSVTDGALPSLLQVQVTVSHSSSNPFGVVKSELTRLVRDPQYFVDAASAATSSSSTGDL